MRILLPEQFQNVLRYPLCMCFVLLPKEHAGFIWEKPPQTAGETRENPSIGWNVHQLPGSSCSVGEQATVQFRTFYFSVGTLISVL